MLSSMKVKKHLIPLNVHPEIKRNNIRVVIIIQSDSTDITLSNDVRHILKISNFPIFSSHICSLSFVSPVE